MKTSIQTLDDYTLVCPQGCMDTASVAEFANALQPVMELSDTMVVVDCKELEYISSSGLRQFILLLKSTRNHGTKLVIKNLNEAVKEVFTMTGSMQIFTIE